MRGGFQEEGRVGSRQSEGTRPAPRSGTLSTGARKSRRGMTFSRRDRSPPLHRHGRVPAIVCDGATP